MCEWKDSRIRPASVWELLCSVIFLPPAALSGKLPCAFPEQTPFLLVPRNDINKLYLYYSFICTTLHLCYCSFQTYSNYSNLHSDSWATGGDNTRILKSIFLLPLTRAPRESVFLCLTDDDPYACCQYSSHFISVFVLQSHSLWLLARSFDIFISLLARLNYF